MGTCHPRTAKISRQPQGDRPHAGLLADSHREAIPIRDSKPTGSRKAFPQGIKVPATIGWVSRHGILSRQTPVCLSRTQPICRQPSAKENQTILSNLK